MAKFRFKKLDDIGSADALEDGEVLRECFVDTGYLAALLELSNPRRIVVGNTGVGKTALLSMVRTRDPEHTIEIPPESLALSYVSNSTILRYLTELGVNLDIFFKLLWRHVFAVELLKRHFKLEEGRDKGIWEWMRSRFGHNKRHAQALDYLRNWGAEFWKETDYRIRETTAKLEGDIEASLGSELAGALKSKQSLSEEQRAEVLYRAQDVVNKVQIRELSEVMAFLSDVFDGGQARYYVVIDRLDERWVDDSLRYRLIRALIETVRDFKCVNRAKIIIALRRDLIERVFRSTRDAGFQEEKYVSLYLDVDWTKPQLTEVVDNRIEYLGKRRYTEQKLTHRDIFPDAVTGELPIDYVLDRTLMRPRDAIHFLNACIKQASDKASCNANDVREAEGEYSRLRLRALADEWSGDYPDLLELTEVLKGRSNLFTVSELCADDLEEICLRLAVDEKPGVGLLYGDMRKVAEGSMSGSAFACNLVRAFYTTGLVGLKLEAYERVFWAHAGRRSVSVSEIQPKTKVHVHKAFWRSLGIRPNR